MRFYCPNCWKDYWGSKELDICPACGYQIKEFNKTDYIDKLINALNHPSGDVRHWVIMILVMRNEHRAIEPLKKIIIESKDPSLVKATKEAINRISSDS